MRYIFFAVTLLSDCLFVSDVLIIFAYFQFTIKVWICLIIHIALFLYIFVIPVTLTAMTLERYVAICMPLRHAELCNTHTSLYCIIIIHGLSSVPTVIISIFFAFATENLCTQDSVCSADMLFFYSWQSHVRSAISQFYFLVMCIIIAFFYVKITKVVKAASGENKKSLLKGLKTVILHSCQLLLCLIQLWCPFIDAAVDWFHVVHEC